MRPQLTHRDLNIGSNSWRLKQLEPIDFVILDKEIPISLYSYKKPKTMHEQIVEKQSAQNSDLEIDAIKTVLTAGVVSLNDKKFNIENHFQESSDLKEVLIIYSCIIDMSFSVKNVIEFKKQTLQNIDAIANRYGMKPIDVLFPNGNYTPLDAYIINSLAAFEGLESRNRIAEQYKLQWGVSLT